jgi:hypothetical protein
MDRVFHMGTISQIGPALGFLPGSAFGAGLAQRAAGVWGAGHGLTLVMAASRARHASVMPAT